MTWTRGGDTAATYPDLMKVHGYRDADERTVNELFGWLMRCAFQTAAHLTDYRIDAGTAFMMGGARTGDLIKLAKKAGLITVEKVDGETWYVLRADPDFIHIPTRKEVEWARQRQRDNADPRIKVHVIRRDGDNCRWCGIGVQWTGRKTNRSAELDHLVPGEAGTVDTMVTACARCNQARQDDTERWDSANELRPVPAAPNFGHWSAKYLTQNGYPTEPTFRSDDEPAQAGADPAPSGVRPATPRDARPARGADPAPKRVRPAVDSPGSSLGKPSSKPPANPLPRPLETGSPGSGRDRSVTPTYPPTKATRQHDPSPPHDQPPASRRRRGRRGGRPRTQQGDQ